MTSDGEQKHEAPCPLLQGEVAEQASQSLGKQDKHLLGRHSSPLCDSEPRGLVSLIGRPKSTTSGQKPKKGLSKEHACFSKQMTQKQIRREYVASVEKELKRHPLATFPHYKDHMTPELFDEVVSILDPDLSVNGAARLPTGGHVEEDDEQVDRAQHRNSGDTLGQGHQCKQICNTAFKTLPHLLSLLERNSQNVKVK